MTRLLRLWCKVVGHRWENVAAGTYPAEVGVPHRAFTIYRTGRRRCGLADPDAPGG